MTPLALALAMLVAPADPSVEDAGQRPIVMQCRVEEGVVVVEVVGMSSHPIEARYALETSAGPGNVTRQRGIALLEAGVSAKLVTTRLSTRGGWSARLTVTPAHGPPYVIDDGSAMRPSPS